LHNSKQVYKLEIRKKIIFQGQKSFTIKNDRGVQNSNRKKFSVSFSSRKTVKSMGIFQQYLSLKIELTE
jgi:hypothetical protein